MLASDLKTLEVARVATEGVISEGGARRALGGVPREQKMLKGHLPRVIYHQVY